MLQLKRTMSQVRITRSQNGVAFEIDIELRFHSGLHIYRAENTKSLGFECLGDFGDRFLKRRQRYAVPSLFVAMLTKGMLLQFFAPPAREQETYWNQRISIVVLPYNIFPFLILS